MAWSLFAILIPAAFPSRPKRRDSLASGLVSNSFELKLPINNSFIF